MILFDSDFRRLKQTFVADNLIDILVKAHLFHYR